MALNKNFVLSNDKIKYSIFQRWAVKNIYTIYIRRRSVEIHKTLKNNKADLTMFSTFYIISLDHRNAFWPKWEIQLAWSILSYTNDTIANTVSVHCTQYRYPTSTHFSLLLYTVVFITVYVWCCQCARRSWLVYVLTLFPTQSMPY